jgi:hypothetical protein
MRHGLHRQINSEQWSAIHLEEVPHERRTSHRVAGQRVWHCGVDLRAAIDAAMKEGAL